MAHPMLTERDYYRLEKYNIVLTECKAKPKNNSELAKKAKTSRETMRNYCKRLIADGYITSKLMLCPIQNQMMTFYSTQIDFFSVDDLVPVSIKINQKMKENGSSLGRKKDKPENVVAVNDNPYRRNIDFSSADMQKKLIESDKLARADRAKTKTRNFVSGSTLSNAV